MIQFCCRVCWRKGEAETEEDAVGAHLKEMLSDEKRTPNQTEYPAGHPLMVKYTAAMHAPDFIFSTKTKKLRVKRDPGPSLFGEEV